MNHAAEHRLRNDLQELRQLGPWIEAFARASALPRPLQDALDHALVEWVTNVISYGFPAGGEHWIQLRFQADANLARVEIEDDGIAFNPLDRPPVDTSAPLETRPIGGLGIHMIRQLMDAVEYRRADGHNILTLIKRRG